MFTISVIAQIEVQSCRSFSCAKTDSASSTSLVFWLFHFVGRKIRNQNIAIKIAALHLFFARSRPTTFFSAVLNALQWTVFPVLVLNWTVAGLFTVLVPTNETLYRAIIVFYHRFGELHLAQFGAGHLPGVCQPILTCFCGGRQIQGSEHVLGPPPPPVCPWEYQNKKREKYEKVKSTKRKKRPSLSA
jgi:hypothetical protein